MDNKHKTKNTIIPLSDIKDIAAQDDSPFAIHDTGMKQLCDKITDNYLELIVEKDGKAYQEQIRGVFKQPKLIADALKRKYKSSELVSRFLYYSFPSQESIHALAEPEEIFLQRLYLQYGENWEKEISKKSVKEEARKLYALKGKPRENAVKEMKVFYSSFLPSLNTQDIIRYIEPSQKRYNSRKNDPRIQETIENFITILTYRTKN